MTIRPPLYDYQKQALALAAGAPAFGLIMEMGTGKSPIIAHEAANLAYVNKLDLLVIVAPDGVHRKWADRELPLHGDLEARYLVSGKTFQWYNELRKWTIDRISSGKLASLCIGYGAVSANAQGFRLVRNLLLKYGQRAMLVLDESHRVKSPSAVRTRSMVKLARKVKWRRILTGTPITRGYEDLYSQFRFLDPNILGFRTFAEFKSTHCVMGGYEMREIVSYRHENILLDKIKPFVFRATKAECLDLPPKVYDVLNVDMSPEQKRRYMLLRDEYLLWLSSGEPIDVALAITRLLRLQQILGGHAGQGSDLEELPCPRLDLTGELVRDALDSNKQVIIWARFRPEVSRLVRVLAQHGEISQYDGSVHQDDRANAVARFQAGQTRIFIGTQAAGGTGLDLTAGEEVIYYSNTFSYEDRAQSEDRAHRIGQSRSVTYRDLVCPGTLDMKIRRALQNRRSLADTVTSGELKLEDLV